MKTLPRIVGVLMILFLCCVLKAVGATDDHLTEPKIDLVFVIDTTGSMSDEIREVKMHIKNVIEEVLEGTPKPNVSIGFVIYRDYPDEEQEYLYKIYSMTNDIDTVMKNLEEIIARGGGDYEEVVTIGLEVAINKLNWRISNGNGTEGEIIGYDEFQNPIYASTGPIKRMMVLIGDAPPRTKEYSGEGTSIEPLPEYGENIEDAIKKNITIFTVSGSGMNQEGIQIWREIAQETDGEYEHLTYDRRNVNEYIFEEELDEEWAEKAMTYSDYDVSDGSILTNSLGDFVKEAVISTAESMGVRYDDHTKDLQYVGDVGYLVDSNSDTVFDVFYCNETGEVTNVELRAGNYLIDFNGDNNWDFIYNDAEGLKTYQENVLSGFEFIIVICGIVFLIIFGKQRRF